MTILHLPPSSSLLPRHPQTPPPHEDPSSVLMDHASGLTLGGGDGDRGGAGRDVGGGDGRGRDGDGDGGGGDGDGGLESAVLDEIDRAAFSFCPAHQAPIPMAQEQSVEWRLGADSAGVRSWMIEGESGQLERVGEGGNRKRGREDGEVIDGGQEDVSRGGKEDALAGEGERAKGAIREAAIATEAIAGTAAVAAAGARDEHHKGENCNESFQALELEGGRGGGGKQEEPGRENCNEEQCSSPSKSCLNLPLDPPSNDFFLLAPALLVYKRRRWNTQRPLQQRNRIAAFPHPASIDSGASMCELPSPQDQCSFDSNREPLPLTGREDRLRDGIDDCSKGWNDRKDEELEKGIRPRIGKLPVDGWTSQGCLEKDENGTVEIIVTSNKYHESSQFDLRTSQSLINGKTFHGRSFFVDISSSALEAGTPGSWQACSHSEKRIAGGRESHLEVGNGYYNELDEDARDEEVGNNTEAELGIVALNERVKSHTEAQASPFGSCEKMGIKNLMETDVEPLKHYYCSRYRQRMAVSRRDSGGVNALPGTELENNNRRLDMITKLEPKRLVQRQSTPQKAEILTNGIKMKKKYISQDRCPLDSPRVDSRIEYITRSSLLAAKESEYKEKKPALQGSAPLHAAESPVSIISRQRKGRFHREVIALKNLMELNSTDSDVLTPNRLRSHGARNTCNNREESKGSYYPARKRRKMQKVNELGSPLAGGTVLAPESGVELLAKQEASERLSLSKALNGSNSNSLFEESLHRRWKDINFAAANPTSLVGCRCKVYWPMDEEWYTGMIHEYDPLSNKHHVVYDDGDMEDLVLAEEWVKLHLSLEEVIALEFQSICLPEGRKKPDYQEMAALAAGLEDWHGGFVHGDLIWAKIKGHPMWPAFVMDEMHADACGLEVPAREGMIPIQFFGSYDYARLSSKQVVPFSYGLLCKFYSKCRRVAFERGLEEAERYLKVQKLPDSMAKLQDEVIDDVPQENDDKETETSEEDEDFMGDERIHKIKKSMESLFTCPIKLGALQVLSLGKIVKDSEHFHDEHHIWTEGYTAVRKFASIKDPAKLVDYRMEVLKNPSARSMPLFRVILEDAEQIEGPTPSVCWRKIFQRLDRVKEKYGLDSCQEDKRRNHHKSGALMFGFSYRRISKLIQALPNARACLKYRGWLEPATEHSEEPLPATFRPVEVLWKHPDRCSVCYLDEEYVNNMFLQCDKCRMLVHMHCYGESEPQDGHLWLCKLCRPGAPKKMPPCCLCPVQGGAMKKTTDGRWAHLTCAMWIPETCLVDIKRMEPIDGLSSISKDRWKLTCSICKVPYGVCIQCSELSCCVAYHILCARSAGLFIEVQEDFHPTDRDVGEEHERPIRLLSYCRRHRQPEDLRDCEGPQKFGSQLVAHGCSKFSYPHNISGCARSEPYDSAARRGRQEPEVRLAASTKRLFVEKMSYLVSGCLRNKPKVDMLPAKRWQVSKPLIQSESRGLLSGENPSDHMALASGENTINIFSMSERYLQMRVTLRQRLTFGKSAIHGWGIFTKQSHLTGDMVIEYAGEVVRPSVADLRERCTYNLLVGAGTYMFRIDDERVVDATRAGSIAHLINHSCEPNCYSRVISVGGEEHIIIFAKRDIEQGEELSYDYRFTSKGERLDCYCGSPRCRGTVNLDDDDEEPAKICVSRKEVTDWVLRTSL